MKVISGMRIIGNEGKTVKVRKTNYSVAFDQESMSKSQWKGRGEIYWECLLSCLLNLFPTFVKS